MYLFDTHTHFFDSAFDEDREEKIKGLLFASPEEVRDAFRRLADYAKKARHRSLITGNTPDKASGIVLPV